MSTLLRNSYFSPSIFDYCDFDISPNIFDYCDIDIYLQTSLIIVILIYISPKIFDYCDFDIYLQTSLIIQILIYLSKHLRLLWFYLQRICHWSSELVFNPAIMLLMPCYFVSLLTFFVKTMWNLYSCHVHSYNVEMVGFLNFRSFCFKPFLFPCMWLYMLHICCNSSQLVASWSHAISIQT